MLKNRTSLLAAFTTLCLTGVYLPALWADKAESEALCQTEVKPYNVGARHIESKGVGYQQGYTTVEGFFTTPKSLDTCLIPFLDLRGHVFNNGKLAANAGLGARFISSRVWGINSYYDYRRTERFHYNQVSVGLESLGKVWDFRLNGYLPVGKKASRLYHVKFHEFEGNSMILQAKREFAMKGVNGEAGVHIEMPKGMSCYIAAGPYYFEGEGKNAIGGEARARVMLHKYLGVSVNGSYDSVFKGIVQGELRLTYPFGPKNHAVKSRGRSCSDTQALYAVAMQPVDRNEIIVVDRKRKLSTAINPDTNDPFFFIFVDNTSHSNGTFESPYNTLADAQNASHVNDVIYVFPGDGTDTGMDAGILLKNNQRLLGSAINHQFTTTLGSVETPRFTSNPPSISNASGVTNVVKLASNNEVSGFTINESTNSAGIAGGTSPGASGQEITNALITHNTIISGGIAAGDCILLDGNSNLGRVIISDNTIQSRSTTVTFGTYFTNNSQAEITINRNLFSGTDSASGLSRAIVLQNLTSSSVDIDSNTLSSQTLPGVSLGITIDHNVASNLDVSITNNLIDMPATMAGAIAAIQTTTTQAGRFSLNIVGNTLNLPGLASVAAGIDISSNASSGLLCVNLEENTITLAPGVTAGNGAFRTLNNALSGPVCVTLTENTAITPNINPGYILVNNAPPPAFNAVVDPSNVGTVLIPTNAVTNGTCSSCN
ncbi:MAG: inverse autotransporter beta domain-containing protein [Chlamydiales bacterium]|nr:inverse autotransporter beta domain-containing protein [Chlamydiales bacterium]